MINRISIGSAQFGMIYGIKNTVGKVSIDEVLKILNKANSLGITNIDSAIGYGESHKLLGQIGVSQWNITTKIEKFHNYNNISEEINLSISKILDDLKVQNIYGLILHNAYQLTEPEFAGKIISNLERLKSEGVVKKIGISIYDPDLLDKIENTINHFDIVQAPLNIIDRRLLQSGWLTKLKSSAIEIQIRSIFLQGLLLMNYESQLKKFNQWRPLWLKWNNWLKQNKISPQEACINFVKSINNIDKIIIGFDSYEQFEDIINIFSYKKINYPNDIISNDTNLINPYLWK